MPFSIFRTKKQKIIAILDIGSASVGGAIVELKKGEIPNILFSTREDMVFQNDLNMSRFISSMLQATEKVLEKFEKYGQEKPHSFFCILSSPWYESKTKILKIRKDKQIIITDKTLDELIQKQSLDFSSIINKSDKINEHIEVIDVKNMQIKLNGYETSNPYGKSAKNIDIALFVGLSSKKVIQSIEDRISRVFYIKDVAFSTFSLASFSAIRDIFLDKKNFLMLDVTGEVTDVSLVEDGVLVESTSFPIGKNFLIRRISNELNTTSVEAVSFIEMINSNKGNKEMNMRVGKILKQAGEKWRGSFIKSLSRISSDIHTPNTVFFTADGNMVKWLTSSIKKEETDKISPYNNLQDVYFLSGKLLKNFCMFKKMTKKDPFIILEAIFINKDRNIF